MAFGVTFKRFEKKFLLSPDQFSKLKIEIDKHFEPDKYGQTKICNLYYDTDDYVLIKRSIDKPVFKEKVRLRTYGIPSNESVSFLEVKRKFNKIVYKRRIHLPYVEAIEFGKNNYKDEKTQISKELNYLFEFYNTLAPRFYISYDRCAYFYKETSDIRITFDTNLTWRNYDLDLRHGSYGEQLLPDGYTIMEIKVPNTVPLWLAKLLSELKIYSTSFSKVGTAYKTMLAKKTGANPISTGNLKLLMGNNDKDDETFEVIVTNTYTKEIN
ncbi:MAG: polyphosphate polymerase domain-containing protein [Clostridia bacterium]|nr:polyphosphate polymerase domain-containing protein [Clostridia bacterium]